jgi:hypothetical protein
MAILVNWFEVTFDRKHFDLPYLDAATWEESTPIVQEHRQADIVRIREDGRIRLYFVTGRPNSAAQVETLVTHGRIGVMARIVEKNLSEHFRSAGAHISTSRWGIEATREIQRFPAAGLVLRQGIHVKYFAVVEPGFRNGITINWVVRPHFFLPIAELPNSHGYGGYPVILRWPASAGACPEGIAPFNDRYLGTIISKPAANSFRVLVRDRSQFDVDGTALFLEARPDVIGEVEQLVSRDRGQQSIQRRILQLSHSLKPDGRRNTGILRDQLRSALKTLDPSEKGQVSIQLLPNCDGKMWIDCYATGVQRA